MKPKETTKPVVLHEHSFARWWHTTHPKTRALTIVVGAALVYLAVLLAIFLPIERAHKTASLPPCHPTSNQWVTYTSRDGSLSVDFPCYPKGIKTHVSSTTKQGLVTKQEYVAKGSDNTNYFLSELIYPNNVNLVKEPSFQDQFVQGLVAGSTGSQLVTSYASTTAAGPAVDFQINNKDQEYYIRGRSILHGNILFALLATNTTGQFIDDDYTRFVNSFKLK